jgi:hypothetical protein
MTLPHCPYEACPIGRNPLASSRTLVVTREDADRMGIPGPAPFFRCGHCDGVWIESEPDAIRPLGKLTNSSGGFRPWEDVSKISLTRGDARHEKFAK